MKRLLIAALLLAGCTTKPDMATEPADYVSTLTGTLSHHAFSTGNTYPAVALPWGNELLDTSKRQNGRWLGLPL